MLRLALSIVSFVVVLVAGSPSAFSRTETFEALFENFALSHDGNRVTNQESRCFDPSEKNETSLGLIDRTGRELLLVCNHCRNGFYVFDGLFTSPRFFTFVPGDGRYGGDWAVAECLDRMDEIRGNLADLQTTTIATEDSNPRRVTDVRASSELTPEDAEGIAATSELFSRRNFKVVATVLESNRDKPLPPEENRRFLIQLGLYRKHLEKELTKCSMESPCKEVLFEEIRECERWVDANRWFLDSLAVAVDFRGFFDPDFQSALSFRPGGGSILDRYEKIQADNALWQSFAANFGRSSPNQQVRSGEGDQKTAVGGPPKNDPVSRAQTAKVVFETCSEQRLRSFELAKVSSDVYVERLDDFLSDEGSTSYLGIFEGYARLGILSPLDPQGRTRTLKSTCSALVDTARVRAEEAIQRVQQLQDHAVVVEEELERGMDVVRSACGEVKRTADRIREEVESRAGVSLLDSEPGADVQALVKQELTAYVNALGPYADIRSYFPAELAQEAFRTLFLDLRLEDGTVLPSPMTTLSASKTFRDQISFDSFSDGFMFHCLAKGEGVLTEPVPSGYNPYVGTRIPDFARKETEKEGQRVFLTAIGLMRALRAEISDLEDDADTCSAGPDDLGDAYVEYLGSDPRDWKRKEIREQDQYYNAKRREIIARYVEFAPGLVMDYILNGEDDPSNLLVMCDSLFSRHKRLRQIEQERGATQYALFPLILGSLFSGPIGFLSAVGVAVFAIDDAGVSIREISRSNRDTLAIQIDLLAGADPLLAASLQDYQASVRKNEYLGIAFDALSVALVSTVIIKGAKGYLAPREKPPIKAPEKLREIKHSKKPFNELMEEALAQSATHQEALATARQIGARVVSAISRKLAGKWAGRVASKAVERAVLAGRDVKLLLGRFNECMKHAGRYQKLTIQNLVHIKEIKRSDGESRVVYKFIKRGNPKKNEKDEVLRFEQTVKKEEMARLKERWGSDVEKWLDRYNANRTDLNFDQWMELSLRTGRYPLNSTRAFMEQEYKALQYTNPTTLDFERWAHVNIRSGVYPVGTSESFLRQEYNKALALPPELNLQQIPVPKPHSRDMSPMQRFWTAQEWDTGKKLPIPPKILGEQNKYVNNAVLATVSDLFIRNYTAWHSYDKKRGDQEFSWWAVLPDMAGNAFKSAVPYIGIKKMDGAVSSMEFGTFPDKMNIWNEQKQAFKASYWPTVKFSAFVEVGGNTLYRAVDEAKESYGNVMYENEVAIARYMAAMTWNASLGIGLKSFVWLFMQGATCMVPNMKTAVKLIGYQGALKGIQFGTAAGLSYGYSYWTSDAFFWLRNFTLHTMGLYTESEMAAQMPLKEVVAGQEVNTLSDLGIDADGTVELSEKTAVVDRTHDSEILAELSFEQIPWWEAEDSPEWDLEEQE